MFEFSTLHNSIFKTQVIFRETLSINELCVCKFCKNVFTKKAGITIITSCPHCDGTNFDIISVNEELM